MVEKYANINKTLTCLRVYAYDMYTVHDPDYRASQSDFHSFVACLQEKLVGLDETIPELPIKDVVSSLHLIMWVLLSKIARCFGFTETFDLVQIRHHTK